MRLGFYTYSYIERLGMEIEPVLEAVAAAGYEGVDVSATWRDDWDPARMPASARGRYAKAADRLGLQIEAVVTHLGLVQALRQHLPLNLKGAVDVARDLGARMVTVHIGFADFLIAETGEVWRAAVNYLKDAAAYAGEHRVALALDGVWSSFLAHSPELVVRLIEDVGSPAFRHNFDPCYLELSGHDPERAAALLGPYSVHAHVKDYTGRYPDFRHRIPGEGVLDHGRYVRALAGEGFDRYLVNECFTDAPLERALAAGYQTLAAALASCGARPARPTP
jgi:sugar phosphate isomerase/epimerase